MADHNDHSHHGHEHGDAHDHAHPAPSPSPAPHPEHESIDDTGSRALADALRSSFFIVKIIMVGLVVIFFLSGIKTIPSQESAIKLRFGKPVGRGEQRLLGPGLHWAWPAPIDEIVRIPISQIQTVTSTAGWYATSPEMEAAGTEPEGGPSLNPATEGYAITADGNIIHVRVTVRYRINNPLNYVLNFVSASNVVQNALNNALLYTAAQFRVDDALSTNRIAFQERIVSRVRELVDQQGLGISVEQTEVRSIPPRFVKRDFDQVLNAEMERRATNEVAQADASRMLSGSQAEAANIVNAGQSDRTRLLKSIAAEARYFEDQLPHYNRDPELFVSRVQTDTLWRILTNTQDKIFLPGTSADGKPRELRLQLNREPMKAAEQPGQR